MNSIATSFNIKSKSAHASPLRVMLSLTLLFALFASLTLQLAAQQLTQPALERGYRTGYTDGYQSGWTDSLNNVAREYRNKDEYARADRAYIAAYGDVADYRDGYRQGFEVGYDAGYNRAGFNSNVPPNLQRRGDTTGAAPGAATTTVPTNGANNPNATVTAQISINTMMHVELLTKLSSESNQRGDTFQARVVDPQEYAGAIISGRVLSVKRASKVSGGAQLQLAFQQIKLPDGRTGEFNAQILSVDETDKNNVSRVDPEGGVRGRPTTKDTVAKVGGSAGIGAVVGAIAGGGAGAAIGAGIGAGVGVGGDGERLGQEAPPARVARRRHPPAPCGQCATWARGLGRHRAQ
ncbi:MAG: hypothetical protein NVSMB56_19970 [Pyrinomonadaceae bacterium]